MLTKGQVLKKLKTVIDPELNVNIVDLGLIYNVFINQKNKEINIKMTLTSPGCPLSFFFEQEVKDVVSKIKGVKDVKIELVWEPIWEPDKMSEEAKEQLGIMI